MKRTTVITATSLFLLAVLLAAGISEAQVRSAAPVRASERASAFDDVIARAGESEVVIENRLSVPLRVFLDGRVAATVRARGMERIVVSDGTRTISVQGYDRRGGISRDVRFAAHSQRVYFRATSPNPTTVSLTRESAYAIAPAGRGGVGVAPSAATQRQGRGVGVHRQGTGIGEFEDDVDYVDYGTTTEVAVSAAVETTVSVAADKAASAPVDVSATPVPAAPAPADDGERPIAETALGQDRAAMFERLDAAVGARAQTPATPTPAPNTFTDSRDGQTYRTVVIGTQTWMAQNLNFNASGSVCYDNNPSNCDTYGRLYDWNTAMAACPAGWRVPSDAEWTALINFVGGESVAGTKLKSTTGWYTASGHVPGTDEFGFSALPGGGGRWSGDFDYVGYWGRWWSATEAGADAALNRIMNWDISGVNRFWDNKTYLFSVRCLQN